MWFPAGSWTVPAPKHLGVVAAPSASRTGRPMLPATTVFNPAALHISPTSAVTVLLPLAPVMAMTFAWPGLDARRTVRHRRPRACHVRWPPAFRGSASGTPGLATMRSASSNTLRREGAEEHRHVRHPGLHGASIRGGVSARVGDSQACALAAQPAHMPTGRCRPAPAPVPVCCSIQVSYLFAAEITEDSEKTSLCAPCPLWLCFFIAVSRSTVQTAPASW